MGVNCTILTAIVRAGAFLMIKLYWAGMAEKSNQTIEKHPEESEEKRLNLFQDISNRLLIWINSAFAPPPYIHILVNSTKPLLSVQLF